MKTENKLIPWGNILIPALISVVVAVIAKKITTDGQIEVAKKEIEKEFDITNLTFTQKGNNFLSKKISW